MKSNPVCLAALLALAAAAVPSAPAWADTVGLRVLVQPWNSATNDDTVLRLVDDPVLISSTLSQAWRVNAPEGIARLAQFLGTADMIHPGVTLYDIELNASEPTLSLHPATLGPASGSIDVTVHFENLSITASATQPTDLGAWADPRCSASFTLDVDARVTVGADLHHPLGTDMTAFDAPIRISNFNWKGADTVCDLAKTAVGLLGWERLITHAVETAADDKSFRKAAVGALNEALEAADAKMAAAPPNLVRVTAWASGQGTARLLTLYFAPQSPVPLPPASLAISGMIRNAGGAGARAISCGELGFSAVRVTGPRPVLNPDGTLGAFPTEPVAASLSCPGPIPVGGSVRYAMGPLPAAPIKTSFHGATTACAGGFGQTRQAIYTSGQNWPALRNDALAPVDIRDGLDLQARFLQEPCRPLDLRPTTVLPKGPTRPGEIRPDIDQRVIQKVNPAISRPAQQSGPHG
jgi:hypothetical protein